MVSKDVGTHENVGRSRGTRSTRSSDVHIGAVLVGGSVKVVNERAEAPQYWGI